MKSKITAGLTLLLLSMTAAAEFETVSLAYEVSLSNLRVPATPSSGVMFKECDDCLVKSLRVTPATEYRVNGKAMTLKEFRKNVFQIRDRANTWAVVLHHLESDTAVSVSIAI